MKSIVLLSGGIDSAVSLWKEAKEHTVVRALAFEYGQRAQFELNCARELAARCHVELTVIKLPSLWSKAITDVQHTIPKDRSLIEMVFDHEATFVPARNMIFLSYALNYAAKLSASRIIVGFNNFLNLGYPDTSNEFLGLFNRTASQALGRHPVAAVAPVQGRAKSIVIGLGVQLGVPFELTMSCYDPVGWVACGRCDACAIRLKAFSVAGVKDPVEYAKR